MILSEAIKILGLQATFTDKTAKKMYRRLAMKLHPDKGGSVAKMQELNEAYKLCCKGVSWGKAPPIEMKFKTVKRKPNLRSIVSWFGDRMLNKLKNNKNSHLGVGWRKMKAEYLFKRLMDECAELEDAMDNRNKENVINECADVANFALIIADKARRKL